MSLLSNRRAYTEPSVNVNATEGDWVHTCCHMCGGGTGIRVLVNNGLVRRIEPNPENPLGVCNSSRNYTEFKKGGGAVCARGNAGIMALYDPDRVKKPLRRQNPEKGVGIDSQWKEISWDEALAEIAGKLQELRAAGTPEKLITFSESSLAADIQRDFCNLFGTPNVSFHTNLCSVSRRAAAQAVLGQDEPLGDYANSKYILLFGWNPLSAIKWAYLPAAINHGIQAGARMVVVDPWANETASRANQWLPIRPGTDGALALAMGHIIIKDGLYNREFVSNWVAGFNEYAEYVRDKTPEWAEEITGITADVIRDLAKEFASSQPSIADGWSGPGHHSNGFNALRAIFALNLLVGSVDCEGGLLLPEKAQLGPSPISLLPQNKQRFDGIETFPYGHFSGSYVETMNRLNQESGPYSLEVGIATMTNLAMSVPGTQEVIEALKKLKLFVVIDTHMSETAELADIVLPGTTYLERYGIVSRGVTWPIFALRQPAVKPIYGQIPEYEIFIELGRRLKLVDATGQEVFSGLTYEEYLDYRLRNSDAHISLKELKELPGAVWKDSRGTRHKKYTQKDYKINTPSGKFELVVQMLPKSRLDETPVSALPEFQFRKWLPDQSYPFFFISWKQANHTHSRTMNNPYLMMTGDTNPLLINKDAAHKLGIKDGDEVWIESPYAKAKTKIRATEGIHPQVVGVQWGFGHWALGKIAKGKGVNASQFGRPSHDFMTGQAIHKEVCVRIYKA